MFLLGNKIRERHSSPYPFNCCKDRYIIYICQIFYEKNSECRLSFFAREASYYHEGAITGAYVKSVPMVP